MKALMKAVKWILFFIVAAVWMGYVADEQASLESAWGKPMKQNEEWRW